MAYTILDKNLNPSLELRTLFQQELLSPTCLCPDRDKFSHSQHELDLTEIAVEKAFAVIAKALEFGVENYLVGPSVKPVFRKYN